jgi:hypothetical protein
MHQGLHLWALNALKIIVIMRLILGAPELNFYILSQVALRYFTFTEKEPSLANTQSFTSTRKLYTK